MPSELTDKNLVGIFLFSCHIYRPNYPWKLSGNLALETTKWDKSFEMKTNKCFPIFVPSFPFMSSNIPSAPAYGVYASQLIRYARCCSNFSDFLLRHRALVTRLLSQGYKVNRLSNTFKKWQTQIYLDNTRKMSVKCLLILSVEMIFIFSFDGFADGRINKIS